MGRWAGWVSGWRRRLFWSVGLVGVILGASLAVWWPEPLPLPAPRGIRVVASRGGTPRYAIPDAVAGATDPDLLAAARTVTEVLRADLAFDDIVAVLPDEATPVLPAAAPDAPPAFEQWQDLGADGVLLTTLRAEGTTIHVDARLFAVAPRRLATAAASSGDLRTVRRAAHEIANQILLDQANIRGVACSRLAFVSDRTGHRRAPTGETRRVKEIFIADYDGANEEPLTFDADLSITPSWSPDGRAVAYTSYRRGFQDIFVALVGERRTENPSCGWGKNWLPAWSPDGARLAFTSSRDGSASIYVMDADGGNVRRVGAGGGIDTSPTWSPTGRQIAFTSNRTGSPQIWIMDADGSHARALTAERYCDRPAWSPPPFNDIAYVSKTSTGFDIKLIDVTTGRQRQLTFGHGFNESPAWSPNGRHLAFSSTRSGTQQIWTMTRTGEKPRQITRIGNNTMPAWSGPVS